MQGIQNEVELNLKTQRAQREAAEDAEKGKTIASGQKQRKRL